MDSSKLNLGRWKANQAVMREGRWMRFERGGRFLVAFLGLTRFGEKLGSLKRQWLFDHGKDPNAEEQIPQAVVDQLTARALFGTIILAWEEVEGLDGRPLPFTEENLVLLLCGESGETPDRFEGVPGLNAALMRFSQRVENFERETAERSKSASEEAPRVGAEVDVAPAERAGDLP